MSTIENKWCGVEETGRGGRTGELQVTIKWVPPTEQTSIRTKAMELVSGIWNVDLDLFPVPDVEINERSGWEGRISETGMPYYVYSGKEDNQSEEEPEEGICQWALGPDTGQTGRTHSAVESPPRMRNLRRRDLYDDDDDDDDDYESQMHFYLHQTNRADGSRSRIEGHALQSTLGRDGREVPAVEVTGGADILLEKVVEESAFEIENIEIKNTSEHEATITFEVIYPEKWDRVSEYRCYWTATLDRSRTRMFNGTIHGRRCGRFDGRRKLAKCDVTGAIPMANLCGTSKNVEDDIDRGVRGDVEVFANLPSKDPPKVIRQLKPDMVSCNGLHSTLRSSVAALAEEYPRQIQHLQQELASWGKKEAKALKENLADVDREGLHHHEVEAGRDGEPLAVLGLITSSGSENFGGRRLESNSIVKEAPASNEWIGQLDVARNQTVDWTFSMRPTCLRLSPPTVVVTVGKYKVDTPDDEDTTQTLLSKIEEIRCCVVVPGRQDNATHWAEFIQSRHGPFAEWTEEDADFHVSGGRGGAKLSGGDRFIIKVHARYEGGRSELIGEAGLSVPLQDLKEHAVTVAVEGAGGLEKSQATLSVELFCRYKPVPCEDTLDLSLWFCRCGEQMARQVLADTRCVEKTSTFTSTVKGKLIFVAKDRLWSNAAAGRRAVATAGVGGPPCDGTLSIGLHRCIELVAADRSAKSDPYVKLRIGESKATSKTIIQDLNPLFGQSIDLDIQTESDLLLHVEVYDKDFGTHSADDFLGEVTVPLAGVFTSDGPELPSGAAYAYAGEGGAWLVPRPMPKQYQLQDPDDRVDTTYDTGQRALHSGNALGSVELSFIGFKPSDTTRQPPPSKGKIFVTLHEAVDLIAADSGKTSDPYVRVRLNNKTKKSNVKKKTLNPKWDQESDTYYSHMQFEVKPGDLSDANVRLELEVWDSNSLFDAFIGGCQIELPTLFHAGWEGDQQQPVTLHQLTNCGFTGDERVVSDELLAQKEKWMENKEQRARCRNRINPLNPFGAVALEIRFEAANTASAHRQARAPQQPISPANRFAAPMGGSTLLVHWCTIGSQVKLKTSRGHEYCLRFSLKCGEHYEEQKTTKWQLAEATMRFESVAIDVPNRVKIDEDEGLCIEVLRKNGAMAASQTVATAKHKLRDFCTNAKQPCLANIDKFPKHRSFGGWTGANLELNIEMKMGGIAGVWSATRLDRNKKQLGQNTLIMLNEDSPNADGTCQLTGARVWDDNRPSAQRSWPSDDSDDSDNSDDDDDEHDFFTIEDGLIKERTKVEFTQEFERSGRTRWKGDFQDGYIIGTLSGRDTGSFTMRRVANPREKQFQLTVSNRKKGGRNMFDWLPVNLTDRRAMKRAHEHGVTGRVERHCEILNVPNMPRKLIGRGLDLVHCPPTPYTLDMGRT
jgi:hypothetical protein